MVRDTEVALMEPLAENHVTTVSISSTKLTHPSYQKPISIYLEFNALSRFVKVLYCSWGPCILPS